MSQTTQHLFNSLFFPSQLAIIKSLVNFVCMLSPVGRLINNVCAKFLGNPQGQFPKYQNLLVILFQKQSVGKGPSLQDHTSPWTVLSTVLLGKQAHTFSSQKLSQQGATCLRRQICTMLSKQLVIFQILIIFHWSYSSHELTVSCMRKQNSIFH